MAEADLRCDAVVEAAQRFARDKSCFYFDSQREIEKPLAVLKFSALQYDTPRYITCDETTSFCATLCNDPLVSHCRSCCVAAPHLMKFFLFHSSTTKEVSARRIFVVLKAQKEMYLLNVSQGSSV